MWPIWKILVFFHRAGNPLQCDHPEKSLYFSNGQVTHYNVTNLKNPHIFFAGQVTLYNVTNLKNPRIFSAEKSSYFSAGLVTHYNVTILKNPHIFFRWVGNPLQCDQSEKSSYFSAGLGTHYNVTTFEKTSYFPPGPVIHYNVTAFKKSSYFSRWAGNPLQRDHFWQNKKKLFLQQGGMFSKDLSFRYQWRILSSFCLVLWIPKNPCEHVRLCMVLETQWRILGAMVSWVKCVLV